MISLNTFWIKTTAVTPELSQWLVDLAVSLDDHQALLWQFGAGFLVLKVIAEKEKLLAAKPDNLAIEFLQGLPNQSRKVPMAYRGPKAIRFKKS